MISHRFRRPRDYRRIGTSARYGIVRGRAGPKLAPKMIKDCFETHYILSFRDERRRRGKQPVCDSGLVRVDYRAYYVIARDCLRLARRGFIMTRARQGWWKTR
jgi:hypothetical protein